jgi:hypothetical protein
MNSEGPKKKSKSQLDGTINWSRPLFQTLPTQVQHGLVAGPMMARKVRRQFTRQRRGELPQGENGNPRGWNLFVYLLNQVYTAHTNLSAVEIR